jgi:hypothetical protein
MATSAHRKAAELLQTIATAQVEQRLNQAEAAIELLKRKCSSGVRLAAQLALCRR